MTVQKEWLDFLRDQYPKGSRIRLIEMKDDPHPIAPGSMGTLEEIDNAGRFLVKWDNGSGLALIIGVDRFQVQLPEPQTLTFYMPLTAQLYKRDDWGDLEEYGEKLDGRALRDYESCIHETLLENQLPEEKERGLMRWYDKDDSVNLKVQSVVFDTESRGGQLWCVAECRVMGELLPEEKEKLADFITGQASDGWGEGFEQRTIDLEEGELYVSLWNSSNWSIQTEEEKFSPDSLTRLPDMCWSVLPGEGTLICIKRGESGYYGSSTKEVSATRSYPNLAGQDTQYIPKTIEEDGRTLTLQTVHWQTDNTANMDGYAVGDRFTAVATYTGTSTSSYVKGYTVTADYTGTVSRIALNKVRYVAIFEGTPLEPVLSVGDEDTAPAQFNWLAIAIPVGFVALVGAGTGAALFMKRRRENSEEDAE